MIYNFDLYAILWLSMQAVIIIISLFYLLMVFIGWRQVSVVDNQVITPSKAIIEFLNVFNVLLAGIAFISTLVIIFI